MAREDGRKFVWLYRPYCGFLYMQIDWISNWVPVYIYGTWLWRANAMVHTVWSTWSLTSDSLHTSKRYTDFLVIFCIFSSITLTAAVASPQPQLQALWKWLTFCAKADSRYLLIGKKSYKICSKRSVDSKYDNWLNNWWTSCVAWRVYSWGSHTHE